MKPKEPRALRTANERSAQIRSSQSPCAPTNISLIFLISQIESMATPKTSSHLGSYETHSDINRK